MNVFPSLVLFAVSTYVGLRISKKYLFRLHFLQDFSKFLSNLELEVNFLQNTVSSIIEKTKNNYRNHFKEFITNLPLDSKLQHQYIYSYKDFGIINDTEVLLIIKFFQDLGRLDCVTQLESIKNIQAQLSSVITNADKKYIKYGKTSEKLGVLFGLAIFIIVL